MNQNVKTALEKVKEYTPKVLTWIGNNWIPLAIGYCIGWILG